MSFMIAEALRNCCHLLVFSGAGVSAESGIATFRDALSGLWARFDPARLATPEAFVADPELVWGWYEWRRQQVLRAAPNAAVLHPGPINRGVEITDEVADGPQSWVLRQVANGVAVRMAVLEHLLGG